MNEDVCYESNDIREVICRFDFATPSHSFDRSMPKEVFAVVRKHFPISEPQEVVGTELQINPVVGAVVNNTISKQWVFWSRDKKSSCIIIKDATVFRFNSYTTFEALRTSVLDVLCAIMKYDDSIQGKRFGLRYINLIELDGHDNWINEQSYDALATHKDNRTTKLETTYEYAIEDKDLNVRLIYGFSNPDYPAIMKKDCFTIDIDAYINSIIYVEDVSTMLNDMHDEAQVCFEKMITNDYREKLNGNA